MNVPIQSGRSLATKRLRHLAFEKDGDLPSFGAGEADELKIICSGFESKLAFLFSLFAEVPGEALAEVEHQHSPQDIFEVPMPVGMIRGSS